MEPEQRRAAKQQMVELMEAGLSWQEAATTAGVQTSRATAYRWKQEARTRGEAALQDGRHGHPAKVLPPVLNWLESRCQATSLVASSHLQKELQEQLGVRLSISHLNAVRATHGWSNGASQAEKKSGRRGSERSAGSRRAATAGSREGRRVCSPSWKRRSPRVSQPLLSLCSPAPHIAEAL
jgi:transposase